MICSLPCLLPTLPVHRNSPLCGTVHLNHDPKIVPPVLHPPPPPPPDYQHPLAEPSRGQIDRTSVRRDQDGEGLDPPTESAEFHSVSSSSGLRPSLF